MPSTIAGCYAEIRKYQTLSSGVSSVISQLNSCNSNYVNLKKNIQENYLVNNDTTPVYDRVSKLETEAHKISNYLSNTILPAIAAAIQALYRRIAELEEEERRRRAESEKAN